MNRRLPDGTLLYMRVKHNNPAEVCAAFGRHGIDVSEDRVDVRQNQRGTIAVVSLSSDAVVDLVNRIVGGDSFFPTRIEALAPREKREGWPPRATTAYAQTETA